MIAEIIKDMPMDVDFESEWIPLATNTFENMGKRRANSMQIAWDGVTGTLDGLIEIYAKSDVVSGALGMTIHIDTASNLTDSEMYIFYPAMEYIKVVFNANSITDGILNVCLSY